MSMRAAESRTLTAGSAFNEPVWATVLLDRRLSQATMIGIKGEGCRPGEQTHAVLLGRRTFVAPPADEGRQLKAGPLSMSHRTLWICPSRGRPLSVAPTPEVGEAGAHRPLEISRAIVAAHACVGAARFPQLHSASSSSITRHETDDEGVISEPEYTLTKPSSGPNHRDHLKATRRQAQARRAGKMTTIELAGMIERPAAFDHAGDFEVSDAVHAPGYGRLNDAVREALARAARHEALLLDAVSTGKAMAGLVPHVRAGRFAAGSRVLSSTPADCRRSSPTPTSSAPGSRKRPGRRRADDALGAGSRTARYAVGCGPRLYRGPTRGMPEPRAAAGKRPW